MEITGRVTKQATVTETKGGKKVVNFTLAINKRYWDKATGEWKEIATFIECAFWKNAGVAEYIRKGEQLHVSGDVGVRAYINKQGEAIGVITFHVDRILGFLGGGRKVAAPVKSAEEITEPVDDLPF